MQRLRIVVLGYLVRGPWGGMAWHHLQYVLGLARLGHDVYFLEDSDDYPSCYDPVRGVLDCDPTYGLGFAADALGRIGFGERWAYYDAHTARWLGPAAGQILSLLPSVHFLLNVSAVNPLRPWFLDVPVRVLIDTDPVFTQIRHLTAPAARAAARLHTAFFSFGENIGAPQCSIPDDGLPWLPTRQPIVLDAWPVTPGPQDGAFTTVMQWESYPAREFQGRRYGMKAESFEPYRDFPQKTTAALELAVGGPTAPRALLRDDGWRVRDAFETTRDPWAYQRYLRKSKGEFSVAKHGYAAARSGWFSERSAAYLASGRPVVVQETGFSDWLPTGAGVVAFGSPDEALAGIEEVRRRYTFHCQEARAIAAAHFDARVVLSSLLDRALSLPASAPR
jgi:hypothetical protein